MAYTQLTDEQFEKLTNTELNNFLDEFSEVAERINHEYSYEAEFAFTMMAITRMLVNSLYMYHDEAIKCTMIALIDDTWSDIKDKRSAITGANK